MAESGGPIIQCSEQPLVGVAIATHNLCACVKQCLDAVLSSDHVSLHVVVLDDGSTDGTWEMLQKYYPSVIALRGDGTLWWTRGTNRAIEVCLDAGCEYVLLLNPDAFVDHDTISKLLRVSQTYGGNVISASLVVCHDQPNIFWWGGTQWGPLKSGLPIWTSRYLFKGGVLVSSLPQEPYETSEVHGRGVLIPRVVFGAIGLYDEKHFPHYGADVDFSLRAARAGFRIYVVPSARVRLHTESTGIVVESSLRRAFQGFWRYLTNRKNGEAIRVWWHLMKRHVPWYAVVPSYLFVLGLNTYRYWRRALSNIGTN